MQDITATFIGHFDLDATQKDVQFVNVGLDRDIPLVIDPVALGQEHDGWAIAANNLVVSFGEVLVDTCRRGDHATAKYLLSRMQEPNDTRFGYSKGEPRGKGIGTQQAGQFFERLLASSAIRNGLAALKEFELVTPGIGRDKISDLTTSLIRPMLIQFTQLQCRKWRVPMTTVYAGQVWDPATHKWTETWAQLPVHCGRRILLVPKSFARSALTSNFHDFYTHTVAPFVAAQALASDHHLVTVLKNGRRVMRKKHVHDILPPTKLSVAEYIETFPELISKYRQRYYHNVRRLSDQDLETIVIAALQSEPPAPRGLNNN